ncbi:hypothetical protein [Streptomyces chattanoogensis]|uniref:Transcription regulator TrmB N-terminal domain-containing protein n=1 Tax=Streptomyces chattanoogensis TaxID=66876 RepID=A0A0N0GXT0_9ACTN|nr:hypothetical protein [Streptomyces chattanoogensis]KPC61329.1 hypothetical protein ADL29_25000 [Streptomyces chattanoogensis]
MSDTTPDSARTPRAATTPEPLTGLTGANAAIYTELIGLTEPVTVAELALAAGVGNSTAGRALTLLEKHGVAVRTRGGHDGPRRNPDLWHPAPTVEMTSKDGDSHAPNSDQPKPGSLDASTPDDSVTNNGDTSADEPDVADPAVASAPDSDYTDKEGTLSDESDPNTPELPSAPDTASTDPATGPETQETEPGQDVQPQATERSEKDDSSEDGPQSEGDNIACAPQTSTAPRSTLTEAIILPGEKRRLAPGALRQMVIDHLEAHPDEAFTATKISRVIEKSSGAIANALDKLVGSGIAEQVSHQPRMFQLSGSAPTDDTQ